jgi:hypothetical protein
MSQATGRRIQFACIIFLIAISAFGGGLAVARYETWPFRWIQASTQAVESLIEFGAILPEGRRVKAPALASRERFTVHAREPALDGYVALLGSDDAAGQYAAWLYDVNGNLLHRWPINYLALDPGGPSTGEYSPHAFDVLEDGSALVSFDGGDVMARVDACGKPIWVKEGIFHHALSRADDGTYWVWRADGSHYAQFHYLTNFEVATGRTLREIGLIEDVIRPLGPHAAIFGVRHDHAFRRISSDPESRAAVDFFHPNDVDILRADLAPSFPGFATGDLLLSFREIDLVAVLDPASGRLRWWSHGPWIYQHDPDFTADGRISVYSNNSSRGRSEILKIDPRTRRVTNELYRGALSFYSASMGTHQYLPGGSVLITVPDEGRVLVSSAAGDLQVEINNISANAPEYNEHVENAIWLPADYFERLPACDTHG